MNYSPLIQTNARLAREPRLLLSMITTTRQWARLAALVLALAFAMALVSGSPAVQADDVKTARQITNVNINTANAQALALALKGVGESRAQEIVRHREVYGPFASADELLEVKGIGKSTLDMNRKLITLE